MSTTTSPFNEIPDTAKHAGRRALLDLLGVAAAGTQTRLSTIIQELVVEQFGAGKHSARLLFDGRSSSPAGAALAGGMLIDSVDAYDGHKLIKSHVGCGVLPALLTSVESQPDINEKDFLTALIIGHEIGTRAKIALHRTASDYHSSGAWVALPCAAVCSRIWQLSKVQTLEALGIAEYHRPRSQMMRCIDYPTMVKDGSGWGAMTGCTAALLAAKGFTGAPAITMSNKNVADLRADLGTRWDVNEQYVNRYPVCRWAQPAIQAVLNLRQQHTIEADEIAIVAIGTFHEAARLAVTSPATTEQAQYSLPIPVAVALVHGNISVLHIERNALHDKRVLELSEQILLSEVEEYNTAFPARRYR